MKATPREMVALRTTLRSEAIGGTEGWVAEGDGASEGAEG